MIFAAGLGTRLRPLTDNCPKALVKVGGEEMLGRIIKRMKGAGIEETVVNVHHFAPMVKDYLKENSGGMRIEIADETEKLLDTGGGVAGAAKFFEGCSEILLHNADVLTDFDLRAMIEAYRKSGADGMLLVWKRESSRCFLFDGEGRLKGWKNRATGEVRPAGLDAEGLQELSFGGVHIINDRIVEKLKGYAEKHGEVFSITQFYIDMAEELDLRAYIPHGEFSWFDIGSVSKLERAEKYISEKIKDKSNG